MARNFEQIITNCEFKITHECSDNPSPDVFVGRVISALAREIIQLELRLEAEKDAFNRLNQRYIDYLKGPQVPEVK